MEALSARGGAASVATADASLRPSARARVARRGSRPVNSGVATAGELAARLSQGATPRISASTGSLHAAASPSRPAAVRRRSGRSGAPALPRAQAASSGGAAGEDGSRSTRPSPPSAATLAPPSLGPSSATEAAGSAGRVEMLANLLPEHPLLVRGRLANGLRYVVLPNPTPPNRFEAHLEVHAGSVDEGEAEQGVAHFVEHVVFLGSRKRERLLGTGARSNAYTDFHHTVFHVHAPTVLGADEEGSGALPAAAVVPDQPPMLPLVLDALVDIAFRPLFSESRVEKERRAVLAEAQMMNTIEYRVDCSLLQHLHWENALGNRFPIGLAEQIEQWPSTALRSFHSRWYFPANATLYLVGDLLPPSADGQPADAAAITAAIEAAFAAVPPATEAPPAPAVPDAPPPPPPALRSRHPVRPPVAHTFALPPPLSQLLPEAYNPALPSNLAKHALMPADAPPRLFQHSLLEQFSLSLFCKLPVLPVRSHAHLRRSFAQRVVLSAVQFRFSRAVQQPGCPFVSCELDHSDSGREGCAVSTLTITAAQPGQWADAIRAALAETRRLARHGVTVAELRRYSAALQRDSGQLAQQSGTVPSVDNLTFVMESDALGHVVMDQVQGHEALMRIAPLITLQECNEAAAELLSYAGFYGQPASARPAQGGLATAVVACAPATMPDPDDPSGELPFLISEAEIQAVLSEPPPAEEAAAVEVVVPDALLPPARLDELEAALNPRYLPLDGSAATQGWAPPLPPPGTPAQRRLSNGLRVNWVQSSSEPGGASLRLVAPGGRAAESAAAGGLGAVALGARTLSEAGGLGEWGREQVELFCLGHLVSLQLEADEEWLLLDLHCALGEGGLEAALQVVHLLLSAAKWDEAALGRVAGLFTTHVRSADKSLERSTQKRLMASLLGGDGRFADPEEGAIGALSVDAVRSAVQRQFANLGSLELSLVGDFEPEVLDAAVLRYLGTLPAPSVSPEVQRLLGLVEEPIRLAQLAADHPQRHQRHFLEDSDERAMAYSGGGAPNRWGWGWTQEVGPDLDKGFEGGGAAVAMDAAQRRAHPLFHAASLALLSEVVNSRLFTSVRDALGLTYDVSFELSSFDRLEAGWWILSVTSTPALVDAALEASLRTLRGLAFQPVSGRDLERARRTLLTRHESDLKDNAYVLGMLTHSQSELVPRKSAACLADMPLLYSAITVGDVHQAFLSLKLGATDVFTCVGVSGTEPPPPPPPSPESFFGAQAPPGTIPDPKALEAALAAISGSNVVLEWQAKFKAAQAEAAAEAAARRGREGGDPYLH